MLLEVKNVTKSFGDKLVLDDVSISAQSGKALGLLGRNGAGKTTTIRIMMDVFPADKGTILVDGKPARKQNLNYGYLPEERGLYPKKVIIDQLVYLAELRGMKVSEAKKSAKKLLERLEMSEYINKKLETLSKGNQQKIQLAATLMCDPKIVILDEPFSGLDPVNATLLKDIVKELMQQDKIVIFSSHQMNYVEEFCDEIAIINSGKIVLSGNIRDIKRSYDRSTMVINGEIDQLNKIKNLFNDKLSSLIKKMSIENEELYITLNKSNMKNELLKAVSQSEFSMDGFNVYEPSLNDIFIEYTEGSI